MPVRPPAGCRNGGSEPRQAANPFASGVCALTRCAAWPGPSSRPWGLRRIEGRPVRAGERARDRVGVKGGRCDRRRPGHRHQTAWMKAAASDQPVLPRPAGDAVRSGGTRRPGSERCALMAGGTAGSLPTGQFDAYGPCASLRDGLRPTCRASRQPSQAAFRRSASRTPTELTPMPVICVFTSY